MRLRHQKLEFERRFLDALRKFIALFFLVLSFSACDTSDSGLPSGEPTQETTASRIDPSAEISTEARSDGSESGVGNSETGEPVAPNPSVSLADATALEASRGSVLTRQQVMERAEDLAEQGRPDEARQLLESLLLRDPRDFEVLFRIASLRAAKGELAEAIELLDEIPEDDPKAGLAVLGQKADWSLQLHRYDAAENLYRAVLERVPEAGLAHRQLARLLNHQGRRHEATPHIKALCQMGDVRQEELHALIVIGDAMNSGLPNFKDPKGQHDSIQAMSDARILFTNKDYQLATDRLRPFLERKDSKPAAWALYGLCAAEAQDGASFRWWISHVDVLVQDYSEYWTALGIYLADQRQPSMSVHALLKATDLDPTDFRAINRLIRMLEMLGQSSEADLWQDRWRENREILRDSNAIATATEPDPDRMDQLAIKLMDAGRNSESVLWHYLADVYRGAPQQRLNRWNEQRQRLIAAKEGFPDRTRRLCGMKISEFKVPEAKFADSVFPARKPTANTSRQPAAAEFIDVASKIGLLHQFHVAAKPKRSGFLIHQQVGGGIAVLDYDQDGSVDLYLAQGAGAPSSYISTMTNLLFRQVDTTMVALERDFGTNIFRHTTGCTTGDWNQDGFPDLVCSNLGQSDLLINNGDGTFSRQPINGSDSLDRLPSSLAIADLNGDACPDLFEVNYLEDSDLDRQPPRDEGGKVVEALGPKGFDPAHDRIGLNDGKGGLVFQMLTSEADAARPGLGLVITDIDGRPGNEVLVGNDSSANQCWVYRDDSGSFVDLALTTGIAFSSGGAGTASMGIASADFDGNGEIDFHIANFQDEPVCLYLQDGGIFRDRAKQFSLGPISNEVLGFGSQAIDYDNDGRRDLFVTNGHVDQYERMNGSFRQPLQLFANLGDRLAVVEVKDESDYCQTNHLGRTLAVLDFNQDGRLDAIINHLDEPSVLLMNQTQTNHHWLQLKLVGDASERDAIGAKVSVLADGNWYHDWVTAGDGYLCCNESMIHFGLGEVTQLDRLQIEWPSGALQVFESVNTDQRLLVVEGQDDFLTQW